MMDRPTELQTQNRILFLECIGGVSGDMCLAALMDLGYPFEDLTRDLSKLGLDDQFEISVKRYTAGAIDSNRVEVKLKGSHKAHRHLSHIKDIIQKSELPQTTQDRAIQIFGRLAQAEAKVHGTTPDKVHFHEVGAVDAIVDIVGASLAVDYFNPVKIYRSPVMTGRGQIECSHGVIPVPAPAVMNLLIGSTIRYLDVNAELVTPTGAAIFTALAEERLDIQFRLERIGYGSGHREVPGVLNTLRISLGTIDTD